ncbi:MAG: hypothetical protein HY886_04320 [Deltaproteobacteria bacterium]|nr:hypothetical protein [Deltaproteobacteria bacterium]
MVVIVVLFLGFSLRQGLANAQEQEVTIEALKQRPEVYVEKSIKLRGKLKGIGGESWQLKKEFVFEDEKGNRFPVTAWRPLSVALIFLGEGKFSAGDPKEIMNYYLNKNLLLRGRIMSKRDVKMLEIEGEHYLHVKEVEELDNPQKGGDIR